MAYEHSFCIVLPTYLSLIAYKKLTGVAYEHMANIPENCLLKAQQYHL